MLAHIFHDERPFANRPRGVAAIGVNARLANAERHRASIIFSTRGTGSCKCPVSQLSALSPQFGDSGTQPDRKIFLRAESRSANLLIFSPGDFMLWRISIHRAF